MAKKIAKFLLFVTTVGAALAGVYYFMKSKASSPVQEDDYEDLDDDSYEVTDDSIDDERSYVSLTPDADSDSTAEKSGTTVEEYFDDDDDDDDSSLDAI